MRWLWLLACAGCIANADAQTDGARIRICDKANGALCAAVNSSGQVSISGSISASTTGKATAAAPSYAEGTDNPLSIDLSGNIRTLATATTAAAATAANPSYVEGSTSALSQDLSGHLRVGATQAGSWSNACTQSGTWTVQPGNTANTTAWKVDGSAVTQPVSGTVAATESGTWTVQPGNTANTTAWLVTGTGGTFPVTGTFWQGTQPVSGTVTTSPPANASTNVAQLAGTTTDTNSGLKSAGTMRVVLATDQPALTNKLLVTPDSVALPANQSVNVSQLAGTTTDTNSGVKSAGTMRVVLATDQPALTNKLLVTPDSVALPANQSVNVNQWGASNVLTGGTAGSVAVGGPQGNNTAITASPILDGLEALSTQPTAATTGNIRRMAGGLDGALYVRPFTQQWSCGLTAIGATLTQCKAAPAAGLKAYVTDIAVISDTATAGQITVRYGTGSNCATGTTSIFPNVAAITTGKYPYPGNTAINPMYYSFATPLAPAAANAVCVICIATQTCTVTMIGYEAP